MNLKEFISYEVNGVADTINEYSRDHYIRNYTAIMVDSAKKKDYELLRGAVVRLIKWYKTIIEKIRNDSHIYNKEQHLKSYNILLNAQIELDRLLGISS